MAIERKSIEIENCLGYILLTTETTGLCDIVIDGEINSNSLAVLLIQLYSNNEKFVETAIETFFLTVNSPNNGIIRMN